MRNNHRPRERDLLSETHDQELSPDEEEDEASVIYTAKRTRSHQDIHRHTTTRAAKASRVSGFSAVLSVGLGWRKSKSEQITTAPGQLGAGETETEADEPVSICRYLSRKLHAHLSFILIAATTSSNDPYPTCIRAPGSIQYSDDSTFRGIAPLVCRPCFTRRINKCLVYV